MYWVGQWGRSVRPRRSSRRGDLFLLETLESRTLLSSGVADPIMWPAVASAASGVATEVSPAASASSPYAGALSPARLDQAYGLSLSATAGFGSTIAIVTAYHDPNIQSDLATFTAQYGLSTASLSVVNQSGQSGNYPTATDGGWSLETAMDVEWAHAAAPGAKLVLVEANTASTSDLMTAVQTAAKLGNVVSMSWGGSEFRGQTAYDTTSYFANPNVTFVAASGDDAGASGASWPSSSPYVVSVGGTTLSASSSGAYLGETAWNASGSFWQGYSGSAGGVSRYEAFPAYQAAVLGAVSRGRLTPDVALNANPSTGVSVYSSVTAYGQSGWFQVGGTSAGAPVWAGLVAAADSARAANNLAPLSTNQTLSLLYSLAGSSSSYAASFHDVTSGYNLVASASKGYDLVTGLGSPIAGKIISAASVYGAPVSASLTVAQVVSTSTASDSRPAALVAALVVNATVVSSAASSVALAPMTANPPAAPAVSSQTALNSASPSLSAGTARERLGQSLMSTKYSLDISHDDGVVLASQGATRPADAGGPTEGPDETVPPRPGGLPGLFFDPPQQPIDEAAPALASGWLSAWDQVMAGLASPPSGGGRADDAPMPPEPAPLIGRVAASGLAVAAWAAWEAESRRGRREEDERISEYQQFQFIIR